MQSKIRRAESDDIVAIQNLDGQALNSAFNREEQIRAAVLEYRCHVMATGSSIQGFAIHKPQAFRGMDFMDLLVVDPSFRRKGIATLLLVHFVENSNTPQSWTSTNRSNGPMISLLRKRNWCESDHIEELDPGDPDLFFFTN